MARVLGEGEVEELDAVMWVASDPGHRNFGTAVDATLLEDEATGFAFVTKGVVVIDGEELFVERIMASGLADWRVERGRELGDVRLLGGHKDASGKRKLELSAAVALMHSPSDPDFPITCVRAAKEFHDS